MNDSLLVDDAVRRRVGVMAASQRPERPPDALGILGKRAERRERLLA